ncbi:MAG TPA: dihydrolipoamide acetyltransferase family protein [Solirubrobacteraceae bacterium]|nr:dihydrolipoamide acetyltransferase family protein [Solirubrobacteraceae bacterium]
MPQMGVSVAEGTVAEWHKQPGDWVEADEPICVISTDKIDTDVPAPAAGRVVEILVPEGETVDVGTVLARIDTGARAGEPHAAEEVQAPAAPEEAPAPAAGNGDRSRRYSPVVMRIAAEHDVDLAAVVGTGRGGRVTKKDVLAFLDEHGEPDAPLHIESPYRSEPEPAPEPAAAAAPEPVPSEAGPAGSTLSRMRRTIGEHMKRSLETAATCTTWTEADMSRIEAARAQQRLTALPLVARCAIAALREHPLLNAWLEGGRYTQHDAVHLGIAVSLGDEGLIVPVIRDAHELSAEGLSRRIKDVAARARSGDLSPDEVRGGTFTITNPGQYGSIMATPVINQPQVAILDLEAVVKRAVVVDDAIAIRPMTIFGLSWDHRALDGVLAAQFLAALKRRVEGWDGG